ncbi:ceramide synthase 1 [Galendromus occidentalis]|uniref:Ceramide synthase 1 n=1 Tax=Galendromus occidentalis TaxID=34638 RepID=A0AAJ6QUW6_9ACAR|nr:ceramide synthase 1 [Galendromus occidentalis]
MLTLGVMSLLRIHEWEPTPSYLELFRGIYDINYYAWHRKPPGRESLASSLLTDFEAMQRLTQNEMCAILVLAVSLTIFRAFLTKFVLRPVGSILNLDEKNLVKFPESAWKLAFHGCMWTYTFYILILSGRHHFFQKPSTVWDGWSMDMEVHRDIYLLYMIEVSYYIHGLYTLFVHDVWRKDSPVMATHHIICILLLWLSYVQRCHNVGILVLFLHDVSDIILEFLKIVIFMRNRQGRQYRVYKFIGDLAFIVLISSWALSRLYYYPLKAMYSTSSLLLATKNEDVLTSCSMIMNHMLYVIFIMDVYWFILISMILFKAMTGSLEDGVDDIREDDVAEREKAPKPTLKTD